MALDPNALLQFYSRKDIQQVMLKLAKNREVTAMYGTGSFGKRPDVLQFPSDVLELARRGATSFHVSEERWFNPLEIQTGMTRKQLDELRAGWDCVLDIDSPYVEYSQMTTYLLYEAFKLYGIKSCGIKFSGRKGFHLMIPFEAFPEQVGGEETRTLFPEGPRMIAEFLQEKIREKLSEMILSKDTLSNIAKFAKKEEKELTDEKGNFDPFKVVDIDTVLISSRHLFRSIYSVNEKSGLISIPIDPERVMEFRLKEAKIENVTTDVEFFKKAEPGEAKPLLIQAFDRWNQKSQETERKSTIVVEGKDYFSQEEKRKRIYEKIEIDPQLLKEEHYPPCIRHIMKGLGEDGRKRALFILLNFFKNLNLPVEMVNAKLEEWNEKNYEKLREGYIQSQVTWFKRQKPGVLPPNCSNEAYYKGLGVCTPDNLCQKIKNPLNYTLVKIRSEQENQKKARKKTAKKAVKKVPQAKA